MIKATSTIKLNMPRIKQLSAASISALEKTAEALKTEVEQGQVIPFATGNLQGESFFADFSGASKGSVSLVHSAPYARRLYYHPEYHFQKGDNPNAKGKWFEDWQDGGEKQNVPKQLYKQFYKQEAKV